MACISETCPYPFKVKLKRGWGLLYPASSLAPGVILSILALELGLKILAPNIPQGESFMNVGQWSALINTVMVISGAVYTGWKPRIRMRGMRFASYWHVVDSLELPALCFHTWLLELIKQQWIGRTTLRR